MYIEKIIIKKLYGFIDKEIEFNNKISILVGINGSGKTSVLNIINWLLKPNLSELCLIEFEQISLYFKFKDDKYIIICNQNKVEITVDLENITKAKKYTQIQATFKVHPNKLTKNESLKESLQGVYEDLGPEEHEKETWSFLFNDIPKPIVIGLDRNLFTEEGEEIRIQTEYSIVENKRIARRNKSNIFSPLEKVKSLLSKEHNIYRNNVLELYSSLNEKIMLSAFDKIFTKTNIASLLKEPKPSVNTIEVLKEQVVNFLRENQNLKYQSKKRKNIELSIKKVNTYFDTLKLILKESQDNDNEYDLLYITNISQFKKINDLIIEFKKFEIDTQQLYFPLKEFLDTINSFFKDSAKQLYFDKENSEVKFNILNREGIKIDDDRDIKNLSSGEKQILILLTYIKYNRNLNVFIIDEPELSLHPKWQGEFLDAVEKLMPNESQLIIATHSPEVIGDKEDFCTVLLPYNN
ncbi:AAA family ATPase [Flavobacterium limnophilum]|uniref:AAA family ATPase n=1 Tax=Flavobacterium limnophilum TaxID=3003262 RepID=UPI0024832626|nr:AAA family ATPase [Flavobacterium limnophilum]